MTGAPTRYDLVGAHTDTWADRDPPAPTDPPPRGDRRVPWLVTAWILSCATAGVVLGLWSGQAVVDRLRCTAPPPATVVIPAPPPTIREVRVTVHAPAPPAVTVTATPNPAPPNTTAPSTTPPSSSTTAPTTGAGTTPTAGPSSIGDPLP